MVATTDHRITHSLHVPLREAAAAAGRGAAGGEAQGGITGQYVEEVLLASLL